MSFVSKFFADGGNVLQHKTAGNSTTYAGYLPTAGVRTISILCIAEMGNSADMTITVKTADDSSGTSATALTQNVPLYKDNVRQDDAKAFTETASSGKTIYVFDVPASIVPAGKYIGVYADSGNSSNYYTAIALEDCYYKP